MQEIIDSYGAIIITVIALWVLPWKGVALWRAAKSGSKPWFVALLVLNTLAILAILDILYIFIFSKKKGGGRQDVQS